jgi:hypothetical protein
MASGHVNRINRHLAAPTGDANIPFASLELSTHGTL